MKLTRIFLVLVFLCLAACASVVRNPVPKADHLNVDATCGAFLASYGVAYTISTNRTAVLYKATVPQNSAT